MILQRLNLSLALFLFLAGHTLAQKEQPILGHLVLRAPGLGNEVRGKGGWLRCGLPLRLNSALKSPKGLRLETADGREIVADFEVLTRREAAPDDERAPIDWLALSFSPQPEDGREFFIREGEPAPGTLSLTDEKGLWRLRGRNRSFVLDPSKPALLRAIESENSNLLAGPALEVFMVGVSGEVVVPGPWQIEIQRQSQAAVVVLATTSLGDLRFEMRLQFVSESGEVVIDLRLINPGPYGHMETHSEHRYFKSLDLSLPVPKSAEELADEVGVMEKPTSWALLQQHEMPYKAGLPAESFPAQLWSDQKQRRNFQRSQGFVAISSKTLGIGYRVDDFWQNAPKNLALHGEELFFGFFPSGGHGPEYRGIYGRPPSEGEVDKKSLYAYRFEGARAKSHRLYMQVSTSSAKLVSEQMAARAQQVLHAGPADGELEGRRILGYHFIASASKKGEAANRFERFAKILVSDADADAQDSLGAIGLPEFMERGGTYGNQPQRGWFNHGDIAWGDGYSSLHYDLPFSVLFQFLRSSDARFFELGGDMARHRRDIDQDHDQTSGFKLAGGQFYEKGYYHGNYYHPSVSHTWLRGPLLHWLLTGDRWSLEAALLNRDFLERAELGHWDGNWGSRIPGWGADQSLALYDLFRDPKDLERAEAALSAYERVETRRDGGQGFVINRQMQPPSCQPWMTAITGIAAAEHGLITGSDRFKALTARIAGFLGGPALAEAEGPAPRVFRTWSPKKREGAEHQLAWSLSAFFALSSELLADEAQRDLSRRLFASAALYQGEKRGSPLAFRMLAYPNSESKIHGTLQIWGLYGLSAFD